MPSSENSEAVFQRMESGYQESKAEGLLNSTLPRLERLNKRNPLSCKAIVLDLDGTLLDNNGNIPQGAREVLQNIERAGRPVILASARPPKSIIQIQDKLGLSSQIVALNGAWVGDKKGAHVAHSLESDTISKVLSYKNVGISLYTKDRWLVNDISNEYIQKEMAIIGFSPDGTTEVVKDALSDPAFTKKILYSGSKFLKITIMAETFELNHIVRDLSNYRCGPLAMAFSKPDYLEIGPYNASDPSVVSPVDKLTGVKEAIFQYNLKVSDILAFGDGQNDARLLASAGHSVSFIDANADAIYCSDETIPHEGGIGVLNYLRQCYLS